jgi:HEAT repeat protein
VRIDALIKLVDLQGSEALPTVIEALADSDETVRQFSLEKSEAAGLLLPPELLTDLVVRDSSERVRMLALHAVGNHPLIDEREKIVLVQYTINDPSPMLQMTASEILSQIENASLMREEDQRIRDEAAQTINEELPLDAPSD